MSSGDSQRLDEILADYLQRVDRGESVDTEQLIADNPSLTEQLRAYFEAEGKVEGMAASDDPPDRDAPADCHTQRPDSGILLVHGIASAARRASLRS